ncbi:sensor histidine kinase [Thermocoleostomius sinensis]|uniref:histidine kinase n=1 Tax=Thermocoleostomius sinensis A174 TaxID=2016057 RepID=A0A9E8ZHT8_9CYAN|nr:ATP-binding protein [Thermocoleostomius sinensis]WAL62069.1 ATP-binding protein [Thermocoleostomius sinensis A174]
MLVFPIKRAWKISSIAKRFPPPLRYSIPTTLLILGSLLGIYSFQREIALANLRNEEKAIDYVRFIGDRTSGILAYLYRQSGGTGTDLVISQLQDETFLNVAVVLDETDQVIISTQRKFYKLFLSETTIEIDPGVVQSVRQTLIGQVNLSRDRKSVQALYPVVFPPAPGEILSSRVGVLFLEYNQLSALQYQAWKDALQRSIEFILFLGLCCIGIWYFFDKVLTLRARRLVEASNRFSEGDLSVRARLSGSDELAKISAAFDRMAGLIQRNTEALQSSQISLGEAHAASLRQAEQLSQTLKELQTTQTQLIQTEKMSSLGQLVAGIAHEINNPVNFIHGNLFPISEYIQNLLALVSLYQQEFTQSSPAIDQFIETIDLDFIAEDLPKTLISMRSGTERIRQIVLTLRNFSRLDESDIKAVDIHEGIDSTLVILQHRFKPRHDKAEIEVIKHYGKLPKVECFVGQINQVFMNILNNSIDALEEHEWTKDEAPKIQICTRLKDSNWIAIHISDNGPGIPEEIQQRLFDPFFTTKPIGKGTGLGMSISYQIVVDKHHGSLQCFSTPNQGAEFVIEIPVCYSRLQSPDSTIASSVVLT